MEENFKGREEGSQSSKELLIWAHLLKILSLQKLRTPFWILWRRQDRMQRKLRNYLVSLRFLFLRVAVTTNGKATFPM